MNTIILCLTEYEKYLNALPNNNSLANVTNSKNESYNTFSDELNLLSNPNKCLTKLLSTIDLYKTEFSKLLKDDDTKLLTATSSFFKKPTVRKWGKYSMSDLRKTKLAGHNARYFTMKGSEAEKANDFLNHLKSRGFSSELKSAKKNPSIIVDLTTSQVTL